MNRGSLSAALEKCTQMCQTMDAPIEQRLKVMADEVRRLSPEFAEIVDRMVKRLMDAGAGARAPAVGETLPGFVLPDEGGKLVSLAKLLEQGKAVIAFHRGHWCPYCRISAATLAQVERDVAARGAVMAVIMPETQKFTRALKAESQFGGPMLSDLDCAYALNLNLAIRINDEKREAMCAAGYDIALFNGSDDWLLPIPATFVVDRDGTILARFVDPDYRHRMSTEAILSAL